MRFPNHRFCAVYFGWVDDLSVLSFTGISIGSVFIRFVRNQQ